MAGREARRTDAPREREQLRETEAAVAPDARIRCLAARVPAHERPDDCAAKLLAQIERHVRQPTGVAQRARRDHGGRRAACALGVGAVRIEPEAQRDADGARSRAKQGDGAVHAATHRDRDSGRIGDGLHRRSERVRERVDGQGLAADRSRLEQCQPTQVLREPVGIRIDDAVTVDAQSDRRPLGAACGIAEELHGIRVKVPRGRRLPHPV